jgi:hypothetical protein
MKAHWTDYVGNPIFEGDIIEHPTGETGKVIHLLTYPDPSDAWRVDYGDDMLSRLCLQIGEKGMAVVVKGEKTRSQPTKAPWTNCKRTL